MDPAGEVVAAEEDLGPGLEVDHGGPQRLQDLLQVLEEGQGPGVHHHPHPGEAPGRRLLEEGGPEPGGEVVHHEVAEVLQKTPGRGLARPGEAREDEEAHPPDYTWPSRVPGATP
ncbi:hypothetical protein TTMY_1677 [Thermus thermophilus]|nr:hypothetical protein TTMY_1677 [Thermus thermophilus]